LEVLSAGKFGKEKGEGTRAGFFLPAAPGVSTTGLASLALV